MNCITGKVGFSTKEEAQRSGQRAYRCPYCKYWHRSGGVKRILNPVLKVLLGALLGMLLMAWATAQEPDYSIIAFNHQICVGMPWQLVLNAQGRPQYVDVVQSSYGSTEYWYYPRGIVRIRDGRVDSIVENR